jgi:hypothetical protein
MEPIASLIVGSLSPMWVKFAIEFFLAFNKKKYTKKQMNVIKKTIAILVVLITHCILVGLYFTNGSYELTWNSVIMNFFILLGANQTGYSLVLKSLFDNDKKK